MKILKTKPKMKLLTPPNKNCNDCIMYKFTHVTLIVILYLILITILTISFICNYTIILALTSCIIAITVLGKMIIIVHKK